MSGHLLFTREDLREWVEAYAEALEECATDLDGELRAELEKGASQMTIAIIESQASTLRMVATGMRHGIAA